MYSEELVTLIDNYQKLLEAKHRLQTVTSLAKQLSTKMRVHFNQRQNIVLARLGQAWHQKMEAAQTTTEWLTSHIYDPQEEEILAVDVMMPYYQQAGENGSKFAQLQLSSIVHRAIIYRGSMHWISQNAIRFGKKYANLISDTTNEAIREQISQAIAGGESLDQLITRIKDVYAQATDYRAEMIGRTEMGRAYNAGALEQDRALGIEQWEWSGCNPECEICAEWLSGNPYDYDGIQYIIANTHPQCVGGQGPIVPENFMPNELAA